MIDDFRLNFGRNLKLKKRDFLHCSRSVARHGVIDYSDCTAEEMYKSAYAQIKAELRRRGVDVSSLEKVRGENPDYNGLQYVIWEAIKNSFDAVAKRAYNADGVLIPDQHKLELQVVVKQRGSRLIVKIKDNGAGVPDKRPGEYVPIHDISPEKKRLFIDWGGCGVGAKASDTLVRTRLKGPTGQEAATLLKTRKSSDGESAGGQRIILIFL